MTHKLPQQAKDFAFRTLVRPAARFVLVAVTAVAFAYGVMAWTILESPRRHHLDVGSELIILLVVGFASGVLVLCLPVWIDRATPLSRKND